MTIPVERTRAVLAAKDFMYDLLNPKATPKVPRAVRERALRVLRHYPGKFDLHEATKKCPNSWGVPGGT